MTERWPLRVTFAHWVLGLISPWLAMTPVEELDDDDAPGSQEMDAAFDAGRERGYEDALRDAPWRDGL